MYHVMYQDNYRLRILLSTASADKASAWLGNMLIRIANEAPSFYQDNNGSKYFIVHGPELESTA